MIGFIKRLWERVFPPKYSPYCPICSGCGEEGCCSPLICTQDPKGKYCDSYLKDLKYGYKLAEKLLKEIYKNAMNEEYYKDLAKIDDNHYEAEILRKQ